ncbi:hypothetical protein ACFW2X_02885 [Streptomyces antibioticus]|uniref:hypothetical protein n=1 Tax=Streptomyces antibioticus TaxID=1890 RepID=UPI0036B1D29F
MRAVPDRARAPFQGRRDHRGEGRLTARRHIVPGRTQRQRPAPGGEQLLEHRGQFRAVRDLRHRQRGEFTPHDHVGRRSPRRRRPAAVLAQLRHHRQRPARLLLQRPQHQQGQQRAVVGPLGTGRSNR